MTEKDLLKKFCCDDSEYDNDSYESDKDYDKFEKDLDWSQTSWDRGGGETEAEYQERLEDLENELDRWL